jgi:hypothetical protein
MNGVSGSDLVMETWRASCAVETELFYYYLREFLAVNCDYPFVQVVHYCTHTAV